MPVNNRDYWIKSPAACVRNLPRECRSDCDALLNESWLYTAIFNALRELVSAAPTLRQL